jgi:putative endonuclease
MFGRGKIPVDQAELGRWGERYTQRFLQRQGWRFVARNITCRGGEIDLIMSDPEGALVFVEVKTRGQEDFQPAESAINFPKKQRMRCAARFFLASHDVGERPCRFDVVIVIASPENPVEVRHYPGAFSL